MPMMVLPASNHPTPPSRGLSPPPFELLLVIHVERLSAAKQQVASCRRDCRKLIISNITRGHCTVQAPREFVQLVQTSPIVSEGLQTIDVRPTSTHPKHGMSHADVTRSNTSLCRQGAIFFIPSPSRKSGRAWLCSQQSSPARSRSFSSAR